MHPWDDWDHIVKIDPDKTLLDGETFEDVCATGTDAITVGGTTGMTEEKMSRVIEACGKYHLPVYIEPSHYGAVVHSNSLDGYLIPVVFNAGDVAWTTGVHKEWIRIDEDINWTNTFPEAYIVLNSDSSVAELTQANCDLAADDVAAYAEVAEHMFGQPIVYIEYSGMLGNPKKVQAAHDALDTATLFYGGGVHDYDSANQMAQHADTIVVGDIVHDEGVDTVRETVRGVKNASQ